MAVFDSVSNVFYEAGVMAWDVFLALGNVVQSKRPVGKVTPEGHPGYGGYWPEYRPAQEGDSRCSCPALNAMANHGTSARFHDRRVPVHPHSSFRLLGIISRSGRGIKFTELTQQIRTTYNFSASFCALVPHIAANMLKRKYSKDTFDLEELDLHNGIEHDGSLTRTHILMR